MHRVRELQMLIDNSLFSDRAWEISSIRFRESIRVQLVKAIWLTLPRIKVTLP